MINGMNDKENRLAVRLYIFSFLIPFLIILLNFFVLHIAPFGERSLSISDANGYYLPYLSYCKTIFQGKHNLIYSFSQGIGGGIVATIWPYLVNPFSWIFLFFQYEAYPIAYSLGVILITALYGLSMYLLLKDIHGHKEENLLISTCYAMSGFAVCFNINTAFFFGGPLCLPLMALGLRKVFRKESPALFIISIAYSIVLQIQMGFAICMAAVLFFVAKLYVENHKGEIKVLFIRFVVCALTGGLLGAVVWIPELFVIRQGRGVMSLEDFVFTSNAPLLQFGSRFFSGANSVNQIAAGFPAVFCGILPLALVILYFLNKNVNRKRRTVYAVLLTIYILGFYIKTFTSIFQGFTHANWFNYRFSFVFVFLLLLIASEQLQKLEEISKKDAKRCGSALLVFALLVFFLQYEFVDGGKVVMDLALLTIMGAAFFFHKRDPERAPRNVLVLFLCVCTFFQLYMNYYFCNQRVFNDWKDSGSRYSENIVKKEPLIRGIQTTDDGFYRIESEFQLDGSIGNDGLFLDYNGVGYAGHTERAFVSAAISKFGIDYYTSCWNFYSEGIPAATDTLLGIKYVLSERDLSEEKGYIRKADIMGLAIYENPYVLPIGILSDDEIMNVAILDEKNVFDNLNAVWAGLSGDKRKVFIEEEDVSYSNHNPTDVYTVTHEEVMKQVEVDNTSASNDSRNELSSIENSNEIESAIPQREVKTEDNRYKSYIEYSFTAKKTGPIYLYDSAPYVEWTGTLDDIMQYVGYYEQGDEVSGKLYIDYAVTEQVMIDTVKGLHICYADQELLNEYTSLIQERKCSIIKDSDNHLSGDVDIQEGQRLLFTIPYDEGWALIVDGAKADLEKTADLFMSAKLSSGRHHYELTFVPVGLNVGIWVSVVAALGMIALCIVIRIKKGKSDKSGLDEDHISTEVDTLEEK